MKKHIRIEEVENGFVMTFNFIDLGQEEKAIAATNDGVKRQVAIWLDKKEDEDTK